MQVIEGDLAPTLQRLLSRVGHVQIADTPRRHEPGTGEINERFLPGRMKRIGFAGWSGANTCPGVRHRRAGMDAGNGSSRGHAEPARLECLRLLPPGW
ncbi:MAG: hypothetical protein HY778_07605 [Betaproteobacteria bacterium]|nr:hypothetical protein [Betaproteobacteria bacterium]